MRSALARTWSRSAACPHHQVAMLGMLQRLAAQRLGRCAAGRRAGRWRFQHARAERIDQRDAALRAARPPAPACRCRMLRSSSSGSAQAASSRRQSTSIGREAGDGAHHHLAVLDRQILAFQQREAEVAGDIGVFEIGVVQRAGRQDADSTRLIEASPCSPFSASRKARKKPARRWTLAVGVEVGKDAAWSRRGFPARSPRPRGPACGRPAPTSGHPGRGRSRRRGSAGNGPTRGVTPTSGRSHSGFSATSCGGQMAVGDQPVLAVEVGHDRFQQVGALDQARGDAVPFRLGDQDRARG